MVKKIVVTGPESSGKTTLCKQLATTLETAWVPEYARSFLNELDRSYDLKDLIAIAKGQIALEDRQCLAAQKYLICDTDLITIKIWSEYKYDSCDDLILELIETRDYDLHLLCSPDIPWTYDSLRENPDDRAELYDLYKSALIFYQKKFVELSGGEGERLEQALMALNRLGD